MISETKRYTYLGAAVSDNNITDQVTNHITDKQIHARKFSSFLAKNQDCPYHVKQKVWNSALNATVFYSSETWLTWLTNNLRKIEPLYNSTMKQMLSVRQSTCNDLIYIETGLPNAKAYVIDKQVRFLRNLRTNHQTDYIAQVINLAIASRSPMGKRIEELEQTYDSPRTKFAEDLAVSIRSSDSSRRKNYIRLNPNLSRSPVLNPSPTVYIPERNRIAVNRLRLSSHYLRIETGRWSRTPEENRLCQCGEAVQTEEHVLITCPMSEHLRHQMNLHYNSINEMLSNVGAEQSIIAEYCQRTLKLYRT